MGGTQVQGLDWSSDPTSVFITQLSQPWHALSCATLSLLYKRTLRWKESGVVIPRLGVAWS